MDSRRIRLLGMLLPVIGAGLFAWRYHTMSEDGLYSLKVAFLGPFALIWGMWVVIDAPSPIRLTLGGWLFLVAAFAAGILNALMPTLL